MKVVCVGDSITAGQHLPGSEEPWPHLLDHADVIAKGVNGDTSRLMLERFPLDVQEQRAEVVFIQAGHNDANRWKTDRGLPRVSPDGYGANLREMIDRCRAFGSTPMLCTLTPVHTSGEYGDDVSFYNDILTAVAKGHEVELVDVRAAFEDADLELLLLSDGLHLSAAGHELYADTAQKALTGLLVGV